MSLYLLQEFFFFTDAGMVVARQFIPNDKIDQVHDIVDMDENICELNTYLNNIPYTGIGEAFDENGKILPPEYQLINNKLYADEFDDIGPLTASSTSSR